MASKYADEGKVGDGGGGVKPMIGTGNERKGSISGYPEEVKQCCVDVLCWMEEKGPNELKDVEPCAQEDLSLVAESYVAKIGGAKGLPQALSVLYGMKDGGVPLYEYTLMGSQEILRVLSEQSPPEGVLPIGSDIDGEYLVLGADGKLSTWDPEEGSDIGPSIADTIASHLEHFRDLLLSNKYEWVDDCGLVEIAVSPKKSSAAGDSRKK